MGILYFNVCHEQRLSPVHVPPYRCAPEHAARISNQGRVFELALICAS